MDGVGAADHDDPYRWGNPQGLLRLIEQARLLVLRGRIQNKEVTEDLPPPIQQAGEIEST